MRNSIFPLLLMVLTSCTTNYISDQSPIPVEKKQTESFNEKIKKWNDSKNKILVLAPLTGNHAEIGKGVVKACLLASTQIKDFEFQIEDTNRIDPLQLYEKTKNKKFNAVLGPVFYNDVRKYEAIFNHTPIFSLSNNSDANNNHVIACGLSPVEELQTIWHHVKEKNDGILFLIPDNAYSEMILKFSKQIIPTDFWENNVNIMKYTSITKEDAERIAETSHQAIFILDPILDNIPEGKQVFTLSSAITNKSNWNGVIFAGNNSDWKNNFLNNYKMTFNSTPSSIDMIAYDICMALYNSSINNSDNFDGCFGKFSYDNKKGMKRELKLYQLDNNEEILLENIEETE